MKKAKYLFMLLPLMLSACSAATNEESSSQRGPLGEKNTPITESTNTPSAPEIPFVYEALEEVPIIVDKDGLEIISIDVANIPAEGIPVGDWNLYGICFKVTYSNGEVHYAPFLVNHFPISTRHYLGEIGHHTVTLLIHGLETTVGFDVIKNTGFHGYTCEFRGAADEVLYTTTVGYYQNVEYKGPEISDKRVDDETITKFVGWDYPLENVHQNMIYKPILRDTEKRFYGDSIAVDRENILSTYEDGDSIRALLYLGRVHRVAMNYSDTYYHTKGDEAKELAFRPLNPYNDTWVNLNNEIVQYGVRYSIDHNTAQYLYGSNASLTSSPSFGANFDPNYTVTSTSTVLDDGSLVDTSILPAYQSVYDTAAEYITYTSSVASDDETGYYRLAVVTSFDIYLSVGFKRLGFNKYYVDNYAQFVCSPCGEKKALMIQYSEDGNFVNTFEKKVDFSNSTLLSVASSLEWGEQL